MPRTTKPKKPREPDPFIDQMLERAAQFGLSPFALSRAVGANPSVLNRWRTGTSPRLSALRPYLDFLATMESERETA